MASKTDPDEYAFQAEGGGLSIREYFACHIMAAMSGVSPNMVGDNITPADNAKMAVTAADALVAALNAKRLDAALGRE